MNQGPKSPAPGQSVELVGLGPRAKGTTLRALGKESPAPGQSVEAVGLGPRASHQAQRNYIRTFFSNNLSK